MISKGYETSRRLSLKLLLESPPASGLYFYDKRGKTSEPLFREMMKLLNFNPKNKIEGLRLFQKAGYLLVDATYQPVNKGLTDNERNDLILSDFCNLVEDLEKKSRQTNSDYIG